MDFKDFLGSPQGAAAITGLVRALLIAAIGFGANLSQPQVDDLLNVVTTALVVVSVVMTGVTVRAVSSRVVPAETTTTTETTAVATNDPAVPPKDA